jgi:hypothetical protein
LGGRLFGRAAGLLAASLWLTSPWAVGLGHLNGIDLPFALAVLGCCVVLARHVDRPSPRTVIAAGGLGGLGLLTSFRGLVLVPILAWAVSLVLEPWWRRLAAAAVALVGAWVTLCVGVRAIAPVPTRGDIRADQAATAEAGARSSVLARAALLVAWPTEYEAGIGYLSQVSGPRPAFLLGREWTGWRWWYWPAAVAVKFPATSIVLAVAGFACWPRPGRRRAAITLLPVAGALGAFTFAQPAQIGLRPMMPVLLVALVAASPVARLWARRPGRVAIGTVVVVQLGSLWAAAPHSLAWTAPPFRPGYVFAADSNLDWGQDIGRFERWARGRHVRAWLFGPLGTDTVADLSDVAALEGISPRDVRGWVAVSASSLTAYDRDALAWLRKYCPVDDIGGTILLYRFEEPPSPEPGPEAPARPCRGSPASRRR